MRGSDSPFEFFRGRLRLVQPRKHRVSVDLVLFLSKLRGIKKYSKVVELGAGFGFLSISIALKFRCRVWAVERDRLMLEMLRENLRLNNVQEKVEVVGADIRDLKGRFERGVFDVVVVNPPFYPSGYGIEDGGFHFESDTTLEDFVHCASFLLRDGGYSNFLLPCSRLYELFLYLSRANLPPRFVSVFYPTPLKGGKLCCVSSIRNVSGPLEFDRPVVLNDPSGGYTEEVQSLLEGFL